MSQNFVDATMNWQACTEQDFIGKIEYVLPEVELLSEGPIDDSVLGFIYKIRKTNKKDFF